jgi:lysophospholipase L1-like esterase
MSARAHLPVSSFELLYNVIMTSPHHSAWIRGGQRCFTALVLAATLLIIPTQTLNQVNVSPSTLKVATVPSHANVNPPPATLNVLALGDSITRGGYGGDDPARVAWRQEFAQLAAAAGTTVDMTVMAAGGWSTADVLPQLAAVLIAVRPDLVIINLGTNDAKDPGLAGFRSRYASILGTILDVSDAKIAPTFVVYSAIGVPFATVEGQVNDQIYGLLSERGVFAVGGSGPGTRWAGWASCDRIAWTYLVDGVHLFHAGYQLMGRQYYRAVAGTYGWPAIPDDSPTSLSGHRP